MNNDEYEGIQEEEIQNVIGRIPYIGVPIGIETHTSDEIEEQIRKLENEIEGLENERQRQLQIANENQDDDEIERIKAEFDREINDCYRILQDWLNDRYNAVPYQGNGLKPHKKTNKWVSHVKAYANKHRVPYNIALKEAKKTYK
jgi:TolA-binding protein